MGEDTEVHGHGKLRYLQRASAWLEGQGHVGEGPEMTAQGLRGPDQKGHWRLS